MGTLTLVPSKTLREVTLYDLAGLEGCFVGSLEQHEIDAFDEAVERGWAERSYEGAGGFLGLAKVRLTPSGRAALDAGDAR